MTDSADEQEQWQQHQDKIKGRREKKKISNRSPPYALFNLLVIMVAIIYGAYHQFYLKDAENKETKPEVVAHSDNDNDLKIPMLTIDELKKFNGEGKLPFKNYSIVKVLFIPEYELRNES